MRGPCVDRIRPDPFPSFASRMLDTFASNARSIARAVVFTSSLTLSALKGRRNRRERWAGGAFECAGSALSAWLSRPGRHRVCLRALRVRTHIAVEGNRDISSSVALVGQTVRIHLPPARSQTKRAEAGFRTLSDAHPREHIFFRRLKRGHPARSNGTTRCWWSSRSRPGTSSVVPVSIPRAFPH